MRSNRMLLLFWQAQVKAQLSLTLRGWLRSKTFQLTEISLAEGPMEKKFQRLHSYIRSIYIRCSSLHSAVMSASLLDGDWDLNRGRLCLLDDHCHRRLACALERQKDSKSLLCGQLESSASGSYPSLSTAPAISLRSSSVKPLDDYHCHSDCCGEPAYCVL
ncbi:hypothetical protein T09_9391 [Trichinella sp. T9]|nr:hypothetical protein T09_9391 [Trichinella sp. T9]KRZ93527.1 hypothetical protein T08_9658 [Trichinella sp. T8]